ncbi:MAG: hypothetical protein HQM16_10010 [Deltaproteobacteria bacterium]|nr:hypothetical protein [Deltaproteobacteria bacterium]
MMKTRNIVIIVLLLLVGVSLACTWQDKSDHNNQNVTTAVAATPSASASTPDIKIESGVVAYYFHGARRCKTCRTIEAYTKEALDLVFLDAITKGQLLWSVINIDLPGNEHFIHDYQLSSSSVILVRFEKGQPREWKNLNRVWQMVHGDKKEFANYIQSETRAYLENKTP